MKVLERRDAFLSDYEVLQFLTKLEYQHGWDDDTQAQLQQNRRKKIKTKRPYNNITLQRIARDTISYLRVNKSYVPQEDEDETTKNENMISPIHKLNDAQFSELMVTLNKFELFKIEKLQIVNQMPRNLVHLYSIIEECDSRFTEDQITEIIGIIEAHS
ncbi:similar to Saccharomyces cerevisiae YJL011C RPC17 RNA polymerase III subunit C17 [Maudiozyma barnettii]|uniref:DNA-directed RNA polymerase III subunit RPC9 n=1 Tax=Maudiozyma barnettii TaxID=61262 RepID=A0A8H2ZIG2_9SACH|nr:DNA-directed RNA polymerase III subunit RPC17 [Kazachstania barnettii]CAB4254913.1 similar to Saccharomyces cerevisiae YJL011C RPC17 RNA polymerase III subunit C17 [Kazachstania barnettii]CAD1783184.1 similar to Saccharomyces cerevisiae YJL011C RPC17 RNA polymerase III subunit C17 [Kazachstania barnettii]